ncbi:hypothetical protein NDU88_005103 [Pleurodeles waltl]|uniref:Uncharacterized protein n=1 Tax=Pleurodeles waltl TaxID=8319 RepID=A0AAV7X072_PLEWA|nr:hypothetical protein NDU88_005103 [Pleurodeles waltl]
MAGGVLRAGMPLPKARLRPRAPRQRPKNRTRGASSRERSMKKPCSSQTTRERATALLTIVEISVMQQMDAETETPSEQRSLAPNQTHLSLVRKVCLK